MQPKVWILFEWTWPDNEGRSEKVIAVHSNEQSALNDFATFLPDSPCKIGADYPLDESNLKGYRIEMWYVVNVA
jgi:hypothetical protein